ncbi:MAG: PQQ-like beta-propeller repeat protein [Theionarchaea archaeon]|nr:PQQ-like beta-propeller repeat protein [Theionarchaea archaeon]
MKQMIRMICIGSLLLIAQSGEGEDWTQLGHNTHHTYSSETFVSRHLEIKWQHQTTSYSESSPAVTEDRVYIFDRESLYCLVLSTGTLLYEVPAYSRCPSTPTVVDGKVYLARDRNHFQCLDALTGNVLWEKELPELHWVNPLVDDTKVYITVDNSTYSGPMGLPFLDCLMFPFWRTLLALDKETGEEIWRYSVPDDKPFTVSGAGFPILVYNNLVFHVNYYKDESFLAHEEKSYLTHIDADTGVVIGKYEGVNPSAPTELGSITPAWITYYRNKIFVSCKGRVMAVDMETQSLVWEYTLSEGEDALFSVGNGVVMASGDNWGYCLDAETGHELWKIPVRGSKMPVITGNDVFIGSFDGTLYRVDIQSGEIVWSYHLGGTLFSPVVAEGCVLIENSENLVYCFGPFMSPFMAEILMVAVILVIVLLLFLRSNIQ